MSKPITIINVLSDDTFNDCHITGSINVPINKLAKYAETSLDPESEIILCSASDSSPESDDAYRILKDLGFSHILIYPGGAAQWVQLQYPTQGACQMAYLSQQEVNHEHVGPTISAEDLRKKMEE